MALPSHIRSHSEIDLPVVCLSRACHAALLLGRRGDGHPIHTGLPGRDVCICLGFHWYLIV